MKNHKQHFLYCCVIIFVYIESIRHQRYEYNSKRKNVPKIVGK